MALNTGTVYLLRNRKTKKALNIYGGDISSSSNVVQWTYDPNDKDQQWLLEYSDGAYYLKTVHNTGYALDAYSPKATGANADVWSNQGSDNRKAQAVAFGLQQGGYYTVRLIHYNLYLSAVSTASPATSEPNGTKSGYGVTSPGNVRWETGDGTIGQHWELIPLGSSSNSDFPETSSHDLKSNQVYQITNRATGRNVNVWNGDCSENSNVVQWTADKTDEDQNWKLLGGTTGYNYLEFAKNPAYVLDAFMPKASGSNADVWTKGDDPAQKLVIRKKGTGMYTISLVEFPNLYLTAIGNTNGTKTGYGTTASGNIRWMQYTGDSEQIWNFIANDVGAGFPREGNHDLVNNTTYQITSIGTGRNVNVWNGDLSKESNVVQWTADKADGDQNWKLLSGAEGTNYLEVGKNASYVLDAYAPKTSGANTDVWTKGDDPAQRLVILKILPGMYTISLRAFPNLFLTAIGNANGTKSGYGVTSPGNIRWMQYTGATDQLWNFHKNTGGSTETPNLPGSTVLPAQGTYNIVSSYGHLNVTSGIDANGVAVISYQEDNTVDQVFRVEHVTGTTARLRAMCSSQGQSRVLDAYRSTGSSVQNGTKAQIWLPNDNEAQLMSIRSVGNGKHVIALEKSGLVLTAASSGRTVTFSAYKGDDKSQHWSFKKVSTWIGEGSAGKDYGKKITSYPAEWIPSPHFTIGRAGYSPIAWVLHYTTSTADSAINTFMSPTRPVSAHFIMRKNGAVVQLVDIKNTAYCNGTKIDPRESPYYGDASARIVREMKTNANYYTISIEFENLTSERGAITQAQIDSAVKLIKAVNAEYGLSIPYDRDHYLGHREMAATLCPGDLFPYDKILAGLKGSSGGSSGGSSSGGNTGRNYATYPCKTMNLTQGYRDGNHSAYTDFPFDEAGEDSGRSWMYCPCDKMKVTRIYGVSPNTGTNTIWLESVGDVDMPSGKGIFTMMVMHPEDDDLANISEGQTFLRGEKMFREGKDGQATGNHFHISLGNGNKTGNGWSAGNSGSYNITTSGGAVKAENVFYLDESFTTVKSTCGISLPKLPK